MNDKVAYVQSCIRTKLHTYKVAYVQSAVAVSTGIAAWLPMVNLVVSIMAALVSTAVGCIALYRFYKNWNKEHS